MHTMFTLSHTPNIMTTYEYEYIYEYEHAYGQCSQCTRKRYTENVNDHHNNNMIYQKSIARFKLHLTHRMKRQKNLYI